MESIVADASTNEALANEAAEALLYAIKRVVASADGVDALEHLADAYAAVVTAMPSST
jgi:hypothetical protein